MQKEGGDLIEHKSTDIIEEKMPTILSPKKPDIDIQQKTALKNRRRSSTQEALPPKVENSIFIAILDLTPQKHQGIKSV